MAIVNSSTGTTGSPRALGAFVADVDLLAGGRRCLLELTCPRTPYLDHPKDRARATSLWERFNSGLVDDGASCDSYESMLLQEWKRCQGLGVDATLREAVVLAEDELNLLMENKAFLVDKARFALERVKEVLSGVPGILIFTDEDGTILHVTGDPRVRVKAADLSNLVEGGQWSESKAGTNGIGTAITKKAPVHVFSSEHFCEGWHQWTCAGAPVLDPFHNEVLGVVDFTTFESDFRASATALSYSVACNIAAELKVQIELERLHLIQKHAIYSARYPSEAVLIYDRMGHLVRCTAGLEAQQLNLFSGDLTVFATPPKEVRQVFVPAMNTPIGTLVVVEKPRETFYSPPLIELATFGDFVTSDSEVKRILRRIEKITPTDLNVLLIGETGTGKELIASYIHNRSERRDSPFVAVNCGAISKELFESKFFGYERGGFTGADPRGRKGLFEAANGGTLFLDEIGELPLDIQAALLRVLETGKFRRIGSEQERTTDCRIVAATNHSLLERIEQGSFRSDLYYRLSVVKAKIPPLRDRPGDIPVLIEHVMKRFCERHAMPRKRISPEAFRVLMACPWPGNVRELRNAVESAIVCADEEVLPQDLPPEVLEDAAHRDTRPADGVIPLGGGVRDSGLSVREHERRLIVTALRKYKKISLAAKALGMSRSTLYRRFDELGIDHKNGLWTTEH